MKRLLYSALALQFAFGGCAIWRIAVLLRQNLRQDLLRYALLQVVLIVAWPSVPARQSSTDAQAYASKQLICSALGRLLSASP